jgi:hypothetical protein
MDGNHLDLHRRHCRVAVRCEVRGPLILPG